METSPQCKHNEPLKQTLANVPGKIIAQYVS